PSDRSMRSFHYRFERPDTLRLSTSLGCGDTLADAVAVDDSPIGLQALAMRSAAFGPRRKSSADVGARPAASLLGCTHRRRRPNRVRCSSCKEGCNVRPTEWRFA